MDVPVFVVNLVAVAGRVDDVETELHAVLNNDWGTLKGHGSLIEA